MVTACGSMDTAQARDPRAEGGALHEKSAPGSRGAGQHGQGARFLGQPWSSAAPWGAARRSLHRPRGGATHPPPAAASPRSRSQRRCAARSPRRAARGPCSGSAPRAPAAGGGLGRGRPGRKTSLKCARHWRAKRRLSSPCGYEPLGEVPLQSPAPRQPSSRNPPSSARASSCRPPPRLTSAAQPGPCCFPPPSCTAPKRPACSQGLPGPSATHEVASAYSPPPASSPLQPPFLPATPAPPRLASLIWMPPTASRCPRRAAFSRSAASAAASMASAGSAAPAAAAAAAACCCGLYSCPCCCA